MKIQNIVKKCITKKLLKNERQIIKKQNSNFINRMYFFKNIMGEKNFSTNKINKLKMIKKGFSYDEYILYDFKNNKTKDYITEKERWATRYINGNYNIIFDDKRLFYEVFSKYFEIPKTIGYIKNNNVIINNEIINYKKLKNSHYLLNGIIIRPIKSGSGKDIHLLSVNKNEYYMDYSNISENDLKKFIFEQKNDIITSRIEQADYSNMIFDKTINTIRLVMIKRKNEKNHKVILAIHRFGTSKSVPVDNANSHGIFALIDLKTYRMRKATSYEQNDFFSKHPDTNSQIEGIKIPRLKKVIEDINQKMEENFSYINFVAWDVVITNDNYKIIEGNASTGVGLFQKYGGLKNTELDMFFKEMGMYK